MEIYEGIADFAAFAAALNAAVQTAGCATFTQGECHLEFFLRPTPRHKQNLGMPNSEY